MGFWSDLLSRPVSNLWTSPRIEYVGSTSDHGDRINEAVRLILARQGMTFEDLGTMPVSRLWATQPYLRTVISFIARSIAQLSLNTFAVDADEQRTRDRTCKAARALRDPGDGKTGYDLIFATVGDLMLYDRAYWLPWLDPEGNPRLRRCPPPWVTPNEANVFTVGSYTIVGGPKTIELPPEGVIAFSGYAPENPLAASPAVDSLRTTLQEQIEATAYRLATWKRGGRVSAVLQRPSGAPDWSDSAREAFREDWYAQYTGSGPRTGGTPILEDGMTLNRIDFNAQEQQFVDAAKLALNTVASAFHVNPTMIGLLDNANYSNTREFRKMLYGDTLGPTLKRITDRCNVDLFRVFDDEDGVERIVDFNVADRTQGTFEEQIVAMQAAVGRPYITADEARARLHMPALGGGAEELVTPLNVVSGGQSSPQDSGSQNLTGGASARLELSAKSAGPRIKAAATADHQAAVERVLAAFLKRQGSVVLSALGAKADDWWDAERWTGELTDDLTKVAVPVAAAVGHDVAKALGHSGEYDPDRTHAYLQKVMGHKAANFNATTRAAVADQVDASDGDPANVFSDDAVSTRAKTVAVGTATYLASFGTGEAARQIAYEHGGSPTKTWEAGANPRASHAEMDGETVGIDEPFSNGCMWPGDGADPAEVAGCNCSVTVSF